MDISPSLDQTSAIPSLDKNRMEAIAIFVLQSEEYKQSLNWAAKTLVASMVANMVSKPVITE